MNARQGVAECDLCLQACPTRALQAGPVLEVAACTGCGACGAACPVAAVTIAGAVPLPPGAPSAGGEVLLSCLGAEAEGRLCLQALGVEALATLWLRGVRKLWLAVGDCATCPSGKGLDFLAKLAAMNALLADRGLPQMTVAQGRHPRLPRLGEDRADPARRGFLRIIAPVDQPPAGPAALARLQGLAPQRAARCAFVPAINPAACTACHACTRLCPEGALTLIKVHGAPSAYQVDATRCTGCGICVAACQEDAIRIDAMARPSGGTIPLHPGTCRGCGAQFCLPETPGPLCPVCAKAPHFRKLHQVWQ